MNNVIDLDAERNAMIIEKCKSLLKVCNPENENYIKLIIRKSKKIVNEYNKKNLTVVDISKNEGNRWKHITERILGNKIYYDIYKKLEDKKDIITKEDLDFICVEHRYSYVLNYYGRLERQKYSPDDKDWLYCDLCSKCEHEYDKLHDNNYKIQDKIDELEKDFKEALENVTYQEGLKEKWVLLRRKIKLDKETTPIASVLTDTIHNQIVKDFSEQNNNFLKKHVQI